MLKNRATNVLLLLVIFNLVMRTTYAAALVKATTPKYPSVNFVVTKCRQQCFLKTLSNFSFRSRINNIKSLLICQKSPDCFMCWDYCRVLRIAETDLAQAMCNDTLFCSKGCRVACEFHHIKFLETLIYEWANNA